MRRGAAFLLISCAAFFFGGCKKTPPGPTDTDGCRITAQYNPSPLQITEPEFFPQLSLNPDNPVTAEGVQLGRMLYYDSLLHPVRALSCAGCHVQSASFTNGSSVNPLAHINLGWNKSFLWDGRVEGSLEDIMLFEVEEFFMTDIGSFNGNCGYRNLVKKAFNADVITTRHLAKALAQFLRTVVSSGSKYDKALKGDLFLTDEEVNGWVIFNTEKGDCFHCHGTALFTDNLFHNNGLDSVFADYGRGDVTGDPRDNGKYKTPTLRNIELTAPYMHDARFQTLEEVVDFYSEGIRISPTIDPLMKKADKGGLNLTAMEKSELIAFLKTLTDTTFINNPSLADPF